MVPLLPIILGVGVGGGGGGGGVNDTGAPVDATKSFTFVPNGTVLRMLVNVEAGKVAFVPEGTVSTVDKTLLYVVLPIRVSTSADTLNLLAPGVVAYVCWRETGQSTKVDEAQSTPVKVAVVLTVVVTMLFWRPSSLFPKPRPVTAGTLAVVVVVAATVFCTAQMLASVVYQIGMVVSGCGPQVCVPSTKVAPAAAPRASVYSSRTRRWHPLSSATDEPSTYVANSATLA